MKASHLIVEIPPIPLFFLSPFLKDDTDFVGGAQFKTVILGGKKYYSL